MTTFDWCEFAPTDDPQVFRCITCKEKVQLRRDGGPKIKRRCKPMMVDLDVDLGPAGWFTLVPWFVRGCWTFHEDEHGETAIELRHDGQRWRLDVLLNRQRGWYVTHEPRTLSGTLSFAKVVQETDGKTPDILPPAIKCEWLEPYMLPLIYDTFYERPRFEEAA